MCMCVANRAAVHVRYSSVRVQQLLPQRTRCCTEHGADATTHETHLARVAHDADNRRNVDDAAAALLGPHQL